MEKIVIYKDAGVGLRSFQRLFAALAKCLPHFIIEPVNHLFFLKSGWEENVALIVFPGGRDLPYHLHLHGEGNRCIRSYVEKGGRFLGICAGGYYGASYIEFEKGGELEICGPRELAFFPGKAVGPAYGKGFFCYESEQGARAASIVWEKGESRVYYNGGCLFEAPEEHPSIQVIARYADLPGIPAAIVYCSVSKGAALLSGVHPEYSAKDNYYFFKYIINKILT